MSQDDMVPNVSEWYSGQTVFITGSSGFVGKVLLYKLLKSCTGIDGIYVLLRRKKGKTATERLEELFSSPMFDQLKLNDPIALKKVKAIEGDVCEKYLGIKTSDWDVLQREVTLFFNAAASVRFDDSLQNAIFTNTRSAKYALLLAKGMKNLKTFVHVSTLYSNCHLSYIPEEVLPTGSDPDKMIQVAEVFSEYQLEVLNRKVLGDFPNTYVYTKNLAEELVYKHRHEIPLVIYRPGIVLTSTKEPEPGWCDSFNGISAFSGASGKGVNRIVLGKPEGILKLINTDACVNGMIVSAWYRSIHLPIMKSDDFNAVFNATDYHFTTEYLREYIYSLQLKYPFRHSIWRGYGLLTSNHFLFQIGVILLHFIPGLLMDTALKITKQKPMLVKIYRKLYAASLNLEYFTSYRCTVETNNFKKLKTIVPEKEKDIFFVDSLFNVTFEQMMLGFVGGVRRLYGLPFEVGKEDIEHAYKMYYIDLVLKIALVGLFIWMLPLKSMGDYGMSKIRTYQDAFEVI